MSSQSHNKQFCLLCCSVVALKDYVMCQFMGYIVALKMLGSGNFKYYILVINGYFEIAMEC